MVVKCWNRRFGCETIHPTHKLEFVVNALRDSMGMIIFDLQGCGGCQRPKTSYLGALFGTLTQHSVHLKASVLLTKDSPRNEIRYDSQSPFSLLISNSRTSLQGLISSTVYFAVKELYTKLPIYKRLVFLVQMIIEFTK